MALKTDPFYMFLNVSSRNLELVKVGVGRSANEWQVFIF
jgi:hypothetical protein